MSRRLISGLLLVFCFTLFSPVSTVFADQLDELREQQEQIRRELEEAKEKLNEKRKEEKSLSQQVQELASQITEVTNQLKAVERKLASAEQKVAEAERDLEKTSQELAEKLHLFKMRLVDIYQNRDVQVAEVLTQSTSLTDFLVRMELFKRIADHDIQMLEEIKLKKKEQEEKKIQLENQRDQVLALKKETQNKQRELQKRKEEQQQLLNSIKHQEEMILKAIKEEEEAHKRITTLIRKLELEREGLSSRAPTKLTWPTPGYGRITSDYGWRVHPILRIKRWHSGIDIGAPWGSRVVSGADGKVVLAEWYGAYGNAVLVMHGGGIVTMYAHLSEILVNEGEFVSQGEVIGRVGSTGLSTGPHLHFEVLNNGEDINPWKFFR